MFARVHTIETTAASYEAGLQILTEQFLPWARDSSGFCGLIGLVDEGREKVLILSLWRDQEALDESAAAGDRLSELGALASGSTRLSLESFEVGVFEILD